MSAAGKGTLIGGRAAQDAFFSRFPERHFLLLSHEQRPKFEFESPENVAYQDLLKAWASINMPLKAVKCCF